jgi:hypothetical protein
LAIAEPIFPVAPVTRITSDVGMEWCPFPAKIDAGVNVFGEKKRADK